MSITNCIITINNLNSYTIKKYFLKESFMTFNNKSFYVGEL